LRCASTSVVITPPLGTSLAGYFTDRKAAGVLDDLYASVLIVEKDGAKVVLIACDLVDWPEEIASPLRATIAKRIGVDGCAVLLSATHTHTGPVTGGELADRDYVQTLGDKIIAAAVEANGHLAPGALEYSAGVDTRFAFNRRYLMKNGSVMTNPGAHNPDVVGPAGVVDHSLQVVRVLDAGGQVAAVVVNCANHADTMDTTYISADWPGYLRARLQEAVGRDVPVLVLNGAAGDVNHFDVMNHRVVQSIDEARRIGGGYGDTALEALERAQPLAMDAVAAVCGSAQVPYRHISDEELAQAHKTVAELKDDPEARLEGHLESQDIARGHKAVRLMFAQGIVDAAREYRDKTKALEVAVVGLGSLGIVGVNGEVFTDIGLAIKQSSVFEHTIVAELVNGSIGYLGTKKAYSQGGYETMWGGRVCDEVEDYVLETVSGLMKQVQEVR